jgi:hypothetical protein
LEAPALNVEALAKGLKHSGVSTQKNVEWAIFLFAMGHIATTTLSTLREIRAIRHSLLNNNNSVFEFEKPVRTRVIPFY